MFDLHCGCVVIEAEGSDRIGSCSSDEVGVIVSVSVVAVGRWCFLLWLMFVVIVVVGLGVISASATMLLVLVPAVLIGVVFVRVFFVATVGVVFVC